jgi:hypothetical protein
MSRGACRAVVDDAEDRVYTAAWLWAEDDARFDTEAAGRFAHAVATAAREFCQREFGVEEAG